MNFIERYRERKKAEELKAQQDFEAERNRNENLIARQKAAMLEKPCAINDMDLCTDKCVHFKNGFTFPFYSATQDTFFVTEYPRCRLWKDR